MVEILMTPNPELVNILVIPMFFIEMFINVILFKSIFNIKIKTKTCMIYVLLTGLIANIVKFVVPEPFSTILLILTLFAAIKFILNLNIIKSIIAVILCLSLTSIIETLLDIILCQLLHLSLTELQSIPLVRLSVLFILYVIIYLISMGIRYFKININVIEDIPTKQKAILIMNTVLGIIAITSQLILLIYYQLDFPILIGIVSIVMLITYFVVNLYSIINAVKLVRTQQSLKESQSYNKTLTILHDNIRTFKHDFHNIVQAIGGYILMNDLAGLEEYHSALLENCQRVNNLTSLCPSVINNPSVYGILTDKYHKADMLGIKINLEVFVDLNTLHMKIYDFTKVLGILMDNAIDAAAECDEKVINVIMKNDAKPNRQLLIIENTYKNKDIDLERIYEKSYTTKKGNSGIGLWDIRNNILQRTKNLNLYTHKNYDYFTQQFEIYG